MRASHLFFLTASLAAGCAHAQLLDGPPATLEVHPAQKPFAIAPSQPAGYMRNEAPLPAVLLKDWRADPRPVAGFNLNRYAGFEAGYLERQDRGYHKIDDGDPGDRAGALGVRGFHTYAAAKATLPLTDKMSAFGLLGLAYSERRGSDASGRHDEDVDLGTFTKLGAEFKVNKTTTVGGVLQNFGATARKWGGASNANGLRASLQGKF